MNQPPPTVQDKRNLAANALWAFWHLITCGQLGDANRAADVYRKTKREIRKAEKK